VQPIRRPTLASLDFSFLLAASLLLHRFIRIAQPTTD
jgi:hypothetical protein